MRNNTDIVVQLFYKQYQYVISQFYPKQHCRHQQLHPALIHWREAALPILSEGQKPPMAILPRSSNLPAELSVMMLSDLPRGSHKGFVATIMWGGISRFQAEGIARTTTAIAPYPNWSVLLHCSVTPIPTSRIEDAIASLRRGGDNYFYGIGPSYFTKLLYFLPTIWILTPVLSFTMRT